MKLFVFEWFVGGGLQIDAAPIDPNGVTFRQARGMVRALLADLSAAGWQVSTTIDDRLTPSWFDWNGSAERVTSLTLATIARLAQQADATWIIAPETGGRLLDVTRFLEQSGCLLLSPNSQLIELASSKNAVARFLGEHGVHDDWGWSIDAERQEWPATLYDPCVIKPDDGAGSEGLRVIRAQNRGNLPTKGVWRGEPLLTGQHLSVVAIQSRGGRWILCEPLYQRFDRQPIGHYIGGSFPVTTTVRRRAVQLVQRALEALPRFVGYVGLDLVIDPTLDPSMDRIVDINPRLTCSYLGLREIYTENLADVVVRASCGEIPCHLTIQKTHWDFEMA